MNHALAIAVAVAYDIYIEVTKGFIEVEWKIENPVSRWEFQQKLSIQALMYSSEQI